MEMDGPTFCESKELEPEEHLHICLSVRTKKKKTKVSQQDRLTGVQLDVAAVSGDISGEEMKRKTSPQRSDGAPAD